MAIFTQYFLRFRFFCLVIFFALSSCGSGEFERADLVNSSRELNAKKALVRNIKIDPNLDLENQLYQVLGSSLNGLQLSLNQIKKSASKKDNVVSYDFRLNYSNAPVCGGQLRLHSFKKSNRNVLFANIPSIEGLDVIDSPVDINDSLNDLSRQLAQTNSPSVNDVKFVDSSECYEIVANKMILTKNLIVEINGLTYDVKADTNGVRDVYPRFFDIQGSATVYETNSKDGTLKSFKLYDLVGDGSLENDLFTTSTSGSKADESDHVFDYDPSDSKFDEASLFVHANEQYDFFKDLGHTWSGDKLTLFVHAVIGGSVNNALYTPASGSNPPKIQVGDGDGIKLQYLPKDADVVAHELGHHIVYDNLKSTRGESLVIHEGLADFFTFARGGDSCLGESICPAGSTIGCEVDAQCLRSADNDYVLNENTKPEPHFKSQFLSGMLWDLHDNEIEADDLSSIVYDGVHFILEESGYHDLILGMLLADEESFDGKYCADIYSAAQDRGLTDYINDFGCEDELPELAALNNAGGSTSTSESSTRGSDDNNTVFGCSSLHLASVLPNQLFNFILLLIGSFAPLLGSLRRTLF